MKTKKGYLDGIKNEKGIFNIIENESMGFAVFQQCNGFSQQVSRWYIKRGNARNKMLKLAGVK